MESQMDNFTAGELAARRFKMLLDDVLVQEGMSQTKASERLGMNLASMQKYMSPRCLNNNFPAYQIAAFHREVSKLLLRHIASEAGEILVPVPDCTPDLEEALSAAATAMKEASEAISEFMESVKDGRVTHVELKRINKEVSEGLSALACLKFIAEQMHAIGKIKEKSCNNK